MVNSRLMYVLETSNLFDVAQYGFRQNKRTLDAMITLDNYVNIKLAARSHVDLISFDITKAFDSVWPSAVLKKFNQVGIAGKMFKYINDFLGFRSFYVTNQGVRSHTFLADLDVPQGSPLSSTLFIVAFQYLMDSLKSLTKQVEFSAYADDLVIYVEDCEETRKDNVIRKAIEKLIKVGQDVGLEFSKEKSKHLHICRKIKNCNPNQFYIEKEKILKSNEIRILGLTLNGKYKFNTHIDLLRVKLIKDFNTLKMISSRKFMINQNTLRKIIMAVVVAKIRYCVEIYGHSPVTHTNKIDVSLNNCKRLMLSSFATTPRETLVIQSGIPNFEMILNKAMLMMYKEVDSRSYQIENQDNDGKKLLWKLLEDIMFFSQEDDIMEITEIDQSKIMIPPWKSVCDQVYSNIYKKKKEDIDSRIANNILRDFLERRQIQKSFFTDGSKSERGVFYAVISE